MSLGNLVGGRREGGTMATPLGTLWAGSHILACGPGVEDPWFRTSALSLIESTIALVYQSICESFPLLSDKKEKIILYVFYSDRSYRIIHFLSPRYAEVFYIKLLNESSKGIGYVAISQSYSGIRQPFLLFIKELALPCFEADETLINIKY